MLTNHVLTKSYFNFLFQKQDREKALEAWSRIGGKHTVGAIYNGGFEDDFHEMGFGWVSRPLDGVSWWRDKEEAFEGEHSLQINFDGSDNVNFRNITQRIVVEPGTTYRVSGYWKGAYVTTRSNLYLDVASIGAERVMKARSSSKRLNWNWEPFEFFYTAPADADFARLTIRRDATESLDNQISGAIWLDALRLEPQQSVSQ